VARVTVKRLVADLVAGADVQAAWARLAGTGRRGVDALLDAMEGQGAAPPEGRDPRDLHDDLSGGLQAIAKVGVGPLVEALERRPDHAMSLVWALGASREEAAVRALVEHAKHKDVYVRWAAVAGLAGMRRRSLQGTLIEALRDRSGQVRFAALEGLVKVADGRAIGPLRRYLRDRRLQPGGRRIAGELLARLERAARGEPGAAPAGADR
jgi:hypothetical protein